MDISIYYDFTLYEVPENHEVLYRAFGSVDEDCTPYVACTAYQIISRTPCGAWIKVYGKPKLKFINLRSQKQWACATIPEAIRQLEYRKKSQIRHCNSAIRIAEEVLNHIKTHNLTSPQP